jgi:hypothetical protein
MYFQIKKHFEKQLLALPNTPTPGNFSNKTFQSFDERFRC